jgi:hypothetical protein
MIDNSVLPTSHRVMKYLIYSTLVSSNTTGKISENLVAQEFLINDSCPTPTVPWLFFRKYDFNYTKKHSLNYNLP